MRRSDDEIQSELIDLTTIDLDAVARLPKSVLERSLRRVLRELSADSTPIVGFRAAITDESHDKN